MIGLPFWLDQWYNGVTMRLIRTVLLLAVSVLSAAVLAQNGSPQKGDSPRPTFEAASVKQNTTPRRGPVGVQPGGRFAATGAPLDQLIQFAFDVTPVQLVGAPDWASADRFDIVATAGHDARAAEIHLMLQSLLEDRFHLALRKEQRDMPIHELVLARADGQVGKSLIQVPSEDECQTAVAKLPPRPATGAGTARAVGCGPISQLARVAFPAVQTAVIDKTGLAGTWYWSVYFDASMLPGTPDAARVNPDPNLSSMPTAFEEQLGLKLRATRGQSMFS
jgi:uncharacterized protein (TIGR03435 family)